MVPQTPSDSSKKLMLQDRLRQAKRKLDGSLSEPLHANKRNKSVFRIEFSSSNPDARHIEGLNKVAEPQGLQGSNDGVPTKHYPRANPRQPVKSQV